MLRANPHPLSVPIEQCSKKHWFQSVQQLFAGNFNICGAVQTMARGNMFYITQPDICGGRKLSVLDIPNPFS